MKPVHFQSRTHLVLWLENNCARKAITRALYEGQVEFFGGFDLISPTTRPGWIMGVRSAHGKIFYVAVICYDRRYGIRILKDVPWDKWVGDVSKGSLYRGDNPNKYEELKNENLHQM